MAVKQDKDRALPWLVEHRPEQGNAAGAAFIHKDRPPQRLVGHRPDKAPRKGLQALVKVQVRGPGHNTDLGTGERLFLWRVVNYGGSSELWMK